jgi:hypothetical protein
VLASELFDADDAGDELDVVFRCGKQVFVFPLRGFGDETDGRGGWWWKRRVG